MEVSMRSDQREGIGALPPLRESPWGNHIAKDMAQARIRHSFSLGGGDGWVVSVSPQRTALPRGCTAAGWRNPPNHGVQATAYSLRSARSVGTENCISNFRPQPTAAHPAGRYPRWIERRVGWCTVHDG